MNTEINKFTPSSSSLTQSSSSLTQDNSYINNQRIIIIILLIILVFSLLGTESFKVINNVITYLITNIGNLIFYISSNLGYSVGTMVDTTSNIASNATISSVQIADGALNSVGDIFRDANSTRVSPEFKKEMDNVANSSKDFLLLPSAKGISEIENSKNKSENTANEYGKLRSDLDDVINKVNNIGVSSSAMTATVDTTENPIQKPITAQKNSWCLVGEYNHKRGCISVNSGDKCMSGLLFDSSNQCIGGAKN